MASKESLILSWGAILYP